MATNLISDTYLTYHTCDVTLYNLSYFFNEELSTHTDAQKLQAELQKVGILVSKVPNIFERKKNEGILNLVRWGGGQICPLRIKKAISLEPNVGLTSNQAVNSSFSVVWRYNKINQV